MRTARRNKQKVYYSLSDSTIEKYETDDDGNIRYVNVDGVKVPIKETVIDYSKPTECYMSLSMSGSESEDKAFGISISDYDATCICPLNAYPIAEGTLIWTKSEIVYKDEDNGIPDKTSADYVVKKCSESLNLSKYILKALNK